jgi:S-DNA-T family DNA segregation ATPase FtsK/SpoIIIE
MQGQDRSIAIHWQRPDPGADPRRRTPPAPTPEDGTVPFNRMPRIQEPLPRGEVKLPAPPAAGRDAGFNWFATLMPLAGVFVMAGVYGGLRGDWRLALPMVIMSGFSATGSFIGRLIQRRQRRRHAEEQATAYAGALEQKREELAQLRQEQQRIRRATDPDLETLLERAQVRDPRLLSRRPTDADFLQVRLGMGPLPSTVRVTAPHPAMPDPRLAQAQALATEYAAVPDVPVTLSLQDGPAGIAGDPDHRTAAARALICHLAAHHAPHEVGLRAAITADELPDWRWLKWLPHTQALGDGTPTLAGDRATARAVLKDLLEVLQYRRNRLDAAQHGDPTPAWPWLVVLVTNVELAREDPALHLIRSPIGRQLHATALFLVDQVPSIPTGCRTVVEILPQGEVVRSTLGPEGETRTCQLEGAERPLCDALARRLTPLRVEVLRPDGSLPRQVRLLDLMGIEDVTTYDVRSQWLRRKGTLQIPIGQRRGGQPMILDLNATGHGPHGLVAGTTGSGKSELLQTLVVALALTHHPHDVGFVLVDFKGGGAFSDLVDLPHTQGFVTDLSGRLTERALVALRAEVDRRKRLFNAAGVSKIERYQQRTWRGEVREPLPRLVVIVDEFAELVSDHPDFIDGLIGIARVGRSLGVHLILATQSPAGVVKQQIWANARFRICLRVESRQESLEMLHRPEAADLPRQPGRGYFQVGNNDVFELFQVARVAGRYRSPAEEVEPEAEEPAIVIERILPLGARVPLLGSAPARERDRPAGGQTDVEVVVAQLREVARQLQIEKLPSPWPDPLPAHVALPDLLVEAGYAGWDGSEWQASPSHPWLSTPIGLLDDPAHQRQVPLLLNLAEQDGQLIVIGAPGSGKAMLARTLVTGLARTHAPGELQIYLLEFTGQALQLFRDLPHVGGILTPLDGERVRRLLGRLLDRLEERKRLCTAARVDGLTSLRSAQPQQTPPAVVVLVPGFAEFRASLPEEMLSLTRLVREGGPYGIHVVMMGDRAGDVPAAISSVVARRIALRLADANEYPMVLGITVRPDDEQRIPPGRGWVGRPPLAFQTAHPTADDEEDEPLALQQMALQMDAAWTGPRPAPVEVLPASLPLRRVMAPPPEEDLAQRLLGAPIGLDDARLEPVTVDLVRDGPHFLVASTPQGGKTTLLTTWAIALAHRNSPQQIQLVLVAGRRGSLNPLAGLPHVLDCCARPEALQDAGVLSRLTAEIDRRERMLTTSSAPIDAFPPLLVMLDDYDEVFTAIGGQPPVQTALERVAKRGRDVGIHVIAAGPLPNMGVGYGDVLVKQIKLGRSGVILRVLDPGDQNPLAVRVASSDVGRMPPGRGILVRKGVETMLQVATTGDQAATTRWVAEIVERWEDVAPARWPEEIISDCGSLERHPGAQEDELPGGRIQ